MTAADVTALRREACAMIAALGPVLDALQVIDDTFANPSPSPHDDERVIAEQLGEALETVEQFADASGTFCQTVVALQHLHTVHPATAERAAS